MTEPGPNGQDALKAAGIDVDAFEQFLRRIAERAADIDAGGQFADDIYKEGVALGLLDLIGDAGEPSVVSMRAIHEATERLAALSPAVALYFAGTRLVAYLLDLFGSSEGHSRWSQRLRSGGAHGSFAITEPAAGSDVRGITTYARRTRDGYELNGKKQWVGFAPVADVAVVLAKLESTYRDADTVALVVPMDSPGASGIAGEPISGFRGMPNGILTFDNVQLPDSAALAVDGFRGMMNGLNYARIEAASYGVGILRGSLEESTSRAATREAYGGVIGDLQAIQAKLGRMYANYLSARQLTLAAGDSYAQSSGGNQDLISVAKLVASDAARAASDDAMQIFGAEGMLVGSRVERLHRDAKVTQIFDGTSEIHETMLGRRMVSTVKRGGTLVGTWID